MHRILAALLGWDSGKGQVPRHRTLRKTSVALLSDVCLTHAPLTDFCRVVEFVTTGGSLGWAI